jgi:hypothetical protein
MARTRNSDRAGWPIGLREPRPGYFTYRSPLTGKEVSLGSDFAVAKREATKQNRAVIAVRQAKREMAKDAVHGVRDKRGLFEPAHIAAEAMLYDSVVGVYFLLHDDAVVYVGKSTDCLRRLSQHRTEGAKVFNRVYLAQCVAAELDRLEALYIDKYRPRYNSSVPAVDPNAVVWRGTYSTVLSTR